MVVNMNIVARIKFSRNLKNSSFAIGYYSYTERWGALNRAKPEFTNLSQQTNKFKFVVWREKSTLG